VADEALILVRLRHADFKSAEQQLTDAVKFARDEGHSWNRIAEALGMTRQSVSERFGKLVA
jgi:biotin operon repressor